MHNNTNYTDALYRKQLLSMTLVQIKGMCSPKTKPENKALLEYLFKVTYYLPIDSKIPQRMWHLENDTSSPPLCVVCGTPTRWSVKQKRYTKHCSNKCRAIDERVELKRKTTCMQRYGEDKSFLNKDHLHQTRNTCVKNNGVLYPLQDDSILKKTQEALFSRYGEDARQYINQRSKQVLKQKYSGSSFGNMFSDYSYRKKAIKTKTERWLPDRIQQMSEYITPLFDPSDYQNRFQDLKWKCVRCSSVFVDTLQDGKTPRCPDCFPKNRIFWKQQELIDFVSSYTPTITSTRSVISPKELDIFSPQFNLAIEFNGLYWHSTLGQPERMNKKYHLNKTEKCLEQQITLLHIFEDEWNSKQEIVKSIIMNKLNVRRSVKYARKCLVKRIHPKQAAKFLHMNHLQGDTRNSSVNLGLFEGDTLIQVMSFGKSRFNKNVEWELHRLCSLINTHVVGGSEKMFSYFTKHFHPASIVTYADRRYFTGAIYNNLGFKFDGFTSPSYFYVKLSEGCSTRYNRVEFQKHKLVDKLEKFDANLTEEQNMLNNGYGKIWDCGNSRWIYSF